MDIYEENYTNVFTRISNTQIMSRHISKYRKDFIYNGKCEYCSYIIYRKNGEKCTCIQGICNRIGIIVKIPQNPINLKPTDCKYNVTIYEDSNVFKEHILKIDLFDECNIVTNFTIENSISHDHDKKVVEYVKKYIILSTKSYTHNVLDKKTFFKGVKSKKSYTGFFLTIVNNMANDTKKDIINDFENPHVSRRKKNLKVRKRFIKVCD